MALVAKAELQRVLEPGLAALTHTYGGLVRFDNRGRVACKGSMVLVKAADQHMIFTAKHVAQAIAAGSGHALVRPDMTPEESLAGRFDAPVRVRLSRADLVWSANEMDVAAFRAPTELVSLKHLRWFDADKSVEAARNSRRLARGEHPLPTVIMGCPNYGHFQEDSLETLSFLPMYTTISTMDLEPWDGISRVPQVHVAVHDGAEERQPRHTDFRKQIWMALRNPSDKHKARLGGYSGGPLVVFGSDGQFLIGLVVEGDYVFGAARVVAIAWDDVMTAFKRARATATATA